MNLANLPGFSIIFDRVESITVIICRIIQKMLLILIFFLFFFFSYSYLQFLFSTSPYRQSPNFVQRVVYLVVGLVFLYNLLYNYVMANRVGPGYAENIRKMAVHLYQIPKICKKCSLPKPVRTHHCSICDRCVIQMDHHCPWLGVCIGHYNRRYFLRFLTYLSFSCFLVVKLVVTFHLPRAEVYLFMLTIGIVISLFGSYHWFLVFWGRTTLQMCEIMDGYQPSRQRWRNFQIVFGTRNVLLAMLPIYIPLTYIGCEWNEKKKRSFTERISLSERIESN